MPATSRFVREPLLRVVAVLGAAALTLTLLPATAQSQEDDFDPTAACPVDAPQSGFDDREEIPDVHVDNVDCGAFFEIVLGFTGGDFGPTQPVSRAQMASFIGRSLDAADVALPEAGEGRDFADVEDGNVHRDNIRRLEAAGITLGGPLGRSEDEFGPNLSIRRDQMVSFIVRAAEFAFGEDFGSSEQQFDDVDEDNVHFSNINFGGEVGLVQGRTADTFDPGSDTRRDQTSAFVVRLLNFLTTPAEVEITDQSAESASVGETITVTATVFGQYRDEAAATASDTDRATLEGEEVTFSAEHAETTGVVVPPQSQTVETNEDGEASFDFTAAQTGTVTVTASIDGPGGTFTHADGDSDTAEKQFVLPLEGEAGDYTGEVISSVYEEATDQGSLVLRGERLTGEEGVSSLLFDSGDQFRLCPDNEAGDAFDGAALDCQTATAAEFDAQAELGDGVDVEYAPGETGTSTFWLYEGAATGVLEALL